jgi:hypothetical protein
MTDVGLIQFGGRSLPFDFAQGKLFRFATLGMTMGEIAAEQK